MNDAVLYKYATLFICFHQTTSMVPMYLGGIVNVCCSTLKWQAVSMKNHLSL